MSLAPRPSSPSSLAVSKTTFFSWVNSGRAMTIDCSVVTPSGVAQPLAGLSSISQIEDHVSLYSLGFLTMMAPADNETRLISSVELFASPAVSLGVDPGDVAAAGLLLGAELLELLVLFLVQETS